MLSSSPTSSRGLVAALTSEINGIHKPRQLKPHGSCRVKGRLAGELEVRAEDD
jgi:hypothetical protein